MASIFVTGGTGYLGSRLLPSLLSAGHDVRCLARAGAEGKVPAGVEVVTGNALDRASFAARVAPADTFVQLVGTPHPSPAKAAEFVRVDLASVRASVPAARDAGVKHFVYVSVAQPAPVMQAYLEVRAEGERLIRESGMAATILRPWYVLGPGHYWAYALVPGYWIAEQIPATRDGARRLGLVTLEEMVRALVSAVAAPAAGEVRVWDVPAIREKGAEVPD